MKCAQILAPPAHQRKQIPLFPSQRTLRPLWLNLFPLCGPSRSLRLRVIFSPASSLFASLLKIKMPMPSAPRIKPRPAARTPRLALHILPNRHLHPASPAQNRPLPPLPSRPNRNRMPRQRLMAILASPVHPATPHLDRNNIHCRPPMRTPRLLINIDPTHRRRLPSVPIRHRRLAHASPRSSGLLDLSLFSPYRACVVRVHYRRFFWPRLGRLN